MFLSATKGTDFEFLDGHLWMLKEPVDYLHGPSKTLVQVPVGFITDFASIPRVFWNVLPPTGSYALAAVVHDWLYYQGGVDRKVADTILKDASAELGTHWLVRRLMYRAVRLFAGGLWAKRRAAQDAGRR